MTESTKLLVPSPDEEEQKQLYLQAVPVTSDVTKAALFFPRSPKWPRNTDGKVKIFLHKTPKEKHCVLLSHQIRVTNLIAFIYFISFTVQIH